MRQRNHDTFANVRRVSGAMLAGKMSTLRRTTHWPDNAWNDYRQQVFADDWQKRNAAPTNSGVLLHYYRAHRPVSVEPLSLLVDVEPAMIEPGHLWDWHPDASTVVDHPINAHSIFLQATAELWNKHVAPALYHLMRDNAGLKFGDPYPAELRGALVALSAQPDFPVPFHHRSEHAAEFWTQRVERTLRHPLADLVTRKQWRTLFYDKAPPVPLDAEHRERIRAAVEMDARGGWLDLFKR